MKYLKLFEEYNVSYTKKISNGRIYYYFTLDELKYRVEFRHYIFDNTYAREYEVMDNVRMFSYNLVNKNPYSIVETVSNITKDFINEYKPNAIKIYHVSEIGRTQKNNELNSRAKLNYRYLKNIKGYKLNYFKSNCSSSTILIISKIGYYKAYDEMKLTYQEIYI